MSVWKPLLPLLVLLMALGFALPVAAQEEPAYDLVAGFEAYLEVWNTGDFALLEDAMTDDFVRYSQWNDVVEGREALAENIAGFYEAVSPEAVHAVEEAVVHGDMAWLQGSVTMPEADEPMIVYQALARFEEGVLAEVWLAEDTLLVLELLGVVELPAEAEPE